MLRAFHLTVNTVFAFCMMMLSLNAADFTWVSGDHWGGSHDNSALWGASWTKSWTGNVTPVNAAGNSVSITNGWPTTNAYTDLIQLRDVITLGTLDVDMSASNGQFTQQTSSYYFIFDNSGNVAQINGVGTNGLKINTPVELVSDTQFNVNNMSYLELAKGLSGNGELIIHGSNSDNNVYFNNSTYSYTGNTRIESGSLLFHQNVTIDSSTNIIVNSLWDLSLTHFSSPQGYYLDPTQTLSGNGTVAMNADIYNESRALKSGGASISPGDFNIGTLTITGAGLSLTGGNSHFEIGVSSHDQIVTNRLYLAGSSAAGNIVISDTGRISTGNVALIDYSGALTGSVSDLNLVLPSGWQGTLSNNTTNTTIDLNITKISKYGTIFIIQ